MGRAGKTWCAHLGVLAVIVGFSVPAAGSSDDLRLVDAARAADAALVEQLLAAGAPVDAAQPDGATALHWAAHRDATAIVDQLIAAGADVNAANDEDIRPLNLAALNRSAPLVERLLEAGADPNAGRESAVLTAAHAGDPAVMALVLAHGGDANAREPRRGQTALMWAAAEGHAEVVKLLAEAGADIHARTSPEAPGPNDRMRQRPGRPEDFPRPASSISANEFTALLFAVRNDDAASLRHLLEAGADPDTTSADGMSALLLATVRGAPAVAHVLLEHGADPNAAGTGYTALHWAAGMWETELTANSITPLRDHEWARLAGVTEGKLELVRALLAGGADPNARIEQTPARVGSSKNPQLPELEGATPFLLAAVAGESEVLRLLAEHGADMGLTTTNHGTPLMAAAGLGRVLGETTVPHDQMLAAVQTLGELGALGDVNAVDAIGNTALHYAAYFKRDAIVRFLADHGADLEIANQYGETALWLSELVVQFAGGGAYAVSPTSTGDLLRELGAQTVEPGYHLESAGVSGTGLRPTYWPNVPHI